ncbi:MAG: type II secretion system F family protein [Candidatus Eisenbacteria bacterium]|nr:type II secretion system F family protein [Candidatus Eisenbacteria bacterium]
MTRFEYVAKSTSGDQRSSFLYAESATAAADILHRDGLVVLSIREVKGKIREERKEAVKTGLFAGHVPPGSIALFTKQLTSMLNAGLPLTRALYSLARDEANGTLSGIVVQVATDIEGGETLSSAMARHPGAFSRLYVSMIRSGEQSGKLVTIMRHLARYMDRTEAIKRKVRSATTYPAFVMGFAILASTILFLKIVPMMANIYEKLNADLPLPTQMVITASRIVGHYIWVPIILVIAVIVMWRVMMRNSPGRLALDGLKLRLPIFGRILKKVVIAKFLRTLGVLVESGLPVMDSLELAGGSSGNEVVLEASQKIGNMVSHGSSLSKSFASTGVFPEIVVQMVSTGEETGTLGEMLANLSDYYDEQVGTSIEGLSSILEPLLIVLIGGIIALLLVAMFLPVFYLGGAIRQGMRR